MDWDASVFTTASLTESLMAANRGSRRRTSHPMAATLKLATINPWTASDCTVG